MIVEHLKSKIYSYVQQVLDKQTEHHHHHHHALLQNCSKERLNAAEILLMSQSAKPNQVCIDLVRGITLPVCPQKPSPECQPLHL